MTLSATPERSADGTARRGPGRPTHQVEVTVAAIVEAAIDAFGRNGFAGTNLRALAQTADISLGTLTHHFPTKTALFVTAHREASRQIAEGYTAALAGVTGVRAELDAMLDRSEQFMVERPSLSYLTIRGATDAAHPDIRTADLARPMNDVMDGIADRAVARAEIDPADRDALRALVLSMLWGLSIAGIDRPATRAASMRAFRLLFHEQLLRPVDGAAPLRG